MTDRAYFEQIIKPLSYPDVEYCEINEAQKNEFLGNALALMFTIDWPEPSGLAMIEALACGTPVIARPLRIGDPGLAHGVTGLTTREFDDLVQAVKHVGKLSAKPAGRNSKPASPPMYAAQYEQIYPRLIGARLNGGYRGTRFEESLVAG